jgi:hypothetical protein
VLVTVHDGSGIVGAMDQNDAPRIPSARFLPTPEGLARFTRTMGYYRMHAVDIHRYPCRCTVACSVPCSGDCGCPACGMQRMDTRLRKSA